MGVLNWERLSRQLIEADVLRCLDKSSSGPGVTLEVERLVIRGMYNKIELKTLLDCYINSLRRSSLLPLISSVARRALNLVFPVLAKDGCNFFYN